MSKKLKKIKFEYGFLNNIITIKIKTKRSKKNKNILSLEKFYFAIMEEKSYKEDTILYKNGEDFIEETDKEILKFIISLKRNERNIFKTNEFFATLEKFNIKNIFYNENEYVLNDYNPIFFDLNNRISMRDINFFGNSDYFFFSGNPYFLYKTSEKEKKFFSAYYNKYGKLPKDKYFDKETKEKLKNFFDAKEIIYANFDKKNIGKNETIFFFNEEKEEVNIFFGGKQSFEKKNGKYFFYKFNQENFNSTLNKILEKFPNLKEEIKISSNKKRINLKCDVPTFLKLYPIFKEGTDDIYMTEKMVELLKKRKQVTIKLFNNKLLPEVDSTFEISNKEKIELLEKIRKNQLTKGEAGNKIVKLNSGETFEIDNNVKELLEVQDELKNYDKISLNKNFSRIEKIRMAVTKKEKNDEEIISIKETFENINKFLPFEPKGIKVELFPYQKTGVNWLLKMYKAGFGGILADDMGLGKTLQVIAFINEVLTTKQAKKILIIAPTSLINNWKEEFIKFCDIKPKMIYNMKKEELKDFLQSYEEGVLITSYEKFANNVKDISDIEFDVCFADETQKIKNSVSGIKRKTKLLKSKVNFAMTGTPIENSVLDLWSIFDFAFSGYLYSEKKFKEYFSIIYNDYDENDEDYDFLSEQVAKNQKKLKNLIKPFILRRKKEVELKKLLKNKKISEIKIQLSDEEKIIYNEISSKALEELEKSKLENDKNIQEEDKKEQEAFNKKEEELEENSNNNKKKKKNTNDNNDKFIIFKLIRELKEVVSLPNIFSKDGKNSIEPSKLKAYKKLLLNQIKNGNRVLVFSSFLTILDESEKFLKENNIKYFRIDGKTPAIERQEITKTFNSNEEYKVVLLSLKAGAAGLNLVGANNVIHYDLWWNPSVENQANDRAFRIGQTKDVEIFKLFCDNTIEEKILALQKKKQDLFDLIIEKDEFVKYSAKSRMKDYEELFK